MIETSSKNLKTSRHGSTLHGTIKTKPLPVTTPLLCPISVLRPPPIAHLILISAPRAPLVSVLVSSPRMDTVKSVVPGFNRPVLEKLWAMLTQPWTTTAQNFQTILTVDVFNEFEIQYIS
jgi:hypothetical protein